MKRGSFLFLDEVAAEMRTSASSIRHWIATGRLRAYRPGRHLLISRADLDAFVAASEWKPGRLNRHKLAAVPE